jgi:quinone-modifying oxidoreductase subunit QmoA
LTGPPSIPEDIVANDKGPILVVGGGIAGITAALEAAEVGHDVILLEKNAYLGGRVAQLHRYFPKLCPPACGLEINYQRLAHNPRIKVHTLAEVVSVSGQEGAFNVDVKFEPRFVNDKCTCCGKCTAVCELEVDDEFNLGMRQIKAASLPHQRAYPARYRLHPELVASAEAQKVKEACEYDAIDLDDKARSETLEVASIIWATGWKPYDAEAVGYYNYGKHPNIITNVMMERLAASDGPTGGKIVRPSDQGAPEHVLFVQCAGSRDINHLSYCSGVCCLASLKQATYLREQYPDCKVTICFIDIRAPGRLEDFYAEVQKDEKVSFVKSKIARVARQEDNLLKVTGEDTATGKTFNTTADLVVLATGIQPCAPELLASDDHGFLEPGATPGQHPAGCVSGPAEVSSTVQEATAAALSAIQSAAVR